MNRRKIKFPKAFCIANSVEASRGGCSNDSAIGIFSHAIYIITIFSPLCIPNRTSGLVQAWRGQESEFSSPLPLLTFILQVLIRRPRPHPLISTHNSWMAPIKHLNPRRVSWTTEAREATHWVTFLWIPFGPYLRSSRNLFYALRAMMRSWNFIEEAPRGFIETAGMRHRREKLPFHSELSSPSPNW